MQISRVLVCLLFGLLPLKDAAASGRADRGLFIPTSAWLVGPASPVEPEDAGFTMPCIMTTQFNNGYVLRFSGGGGKLLAMAVDFRQDAFDTGDRYDIGLTVEPNFDASIRATAHNAGTLLAGLEDHAGLYQALAAGKVLTVTVGGKALPFSLLGAGDGLRRVENCFRPDAPVSGSAPYVSGEKKADRAKPKGAAPVYVSQTRAEEAEQTPDFNALSAVTASHFEKAQAGASATRQPAPDAAAGMAGQLAELDSMIKGAAQKLAALEPAAGFGKTGPVARSPAAPEAAFAAMSPQEAPDPEAAIAARPIGKPLAANWLSPLVRQREGMSSQGVTAPPSLNATAPAATLASAQVPGQVPVTPIQQAALQPVGAAQNQALAPGDLRRWRAIRGTNLHEILDIWTKNENVRLVWKTQHEFAIAESFSIQGTFEEAVRNVLEQYAGDDKRPAGRIYFDPVMNQRVLLIEASASGT